MSTALADIFAARRYAIAPELLLSPEGPRPNAVMLVEDGAVEAVADRADFVRAFPDTAVTPLPGRAVVPGFIDSHLHLGQGFGKAITSGEPSQIWQRIWIPLEKMLDPELCYVCAKWMFLEALRGGFTTIANFAIINSEKIDAIHRAALETGVRLVSSTGSVDRAAYNNVTGLTPKFESIDAALKRAEIHIAQCNGQTRIYPSLCVSGVQAASPELIAATAEFGLANRALFQIHANEHHPEVHASIVEYGKRPIHYIADSGGLGPNTLVHHAAVVTDSEVELLAQSRAGISYNPVACQWKLDAVAPAMEYAERGMRMGLGTDSTRSDAFRMIDAAESCQRIAYGMRVMDFSCGAGWTWVDAATRGGADVCGLGEVTGQLAAGYRADFLLLDMATPEVLPSWDFEWELVRFYNRDQIDVVVIDGAPVMASGRALDWDQEAFLEESLPKAIATVEAADIVRRHGPSADYRHRGRSE